MKNKQRNELLNKRGALNKSFVIKKSAIISRKISKLLNRNLRVASYSPYNNEVDPNLFLNPSLLFYPKVETVKNARMSFYRGTLGKSFKGIKEPKLFKRKAFKKDLDIIIVPGIAFDKRGYRIGYGAGFYDRFLKDFRGKKIGVAFDCCIVERVPVSKNDVPVDVILTEKRKILCKLRR